MAAGPERRDNRKAFDLRVFVAVTHRDHGTAPGIRRMTHCDPRETATGRQDRLCLIRHYSDISGWTVSRPDSNAAVTTDFRQSVHSPASKPRRGGVRGSATVYRTCTSARSRTAAHPSYGRTPEQCFRSSPVITTIHDA